MEYKIAKLGLPDLVSTIFSVNNLHIVGTFIVILLPEES